MASRIRCLFHSGTKSPLGNISKSPWLGFIHFGSVNFHTSVSLQEKAKSKMVGNLYFSPAPDVIAKWSPPKWQHQWLNMMKRKALIESEVQPIRSEQLNWDYTAELHGLAHRLHIQVHGDALKLAFTEPACNDDENEISAVLDKTDNTAMFVTGKEFTSAFIQLYLLHTFPKLGKECSASCVEYLMSDELLSYIAGNLGYENLIQCIEYPASASALTRCFYASITAILQGPGGGIEAAKFIHDFVLTNLNDKDIVHDIWKPQDPMKYLIRELNSRNLPIPEVRLTKQSGITSVLPVFFVGIFCDKKLLAESGGESLIKAETDAAKLALKAIYEVDINRYLPVVNVFSNENFCHKISKLYGSKNPQIGKFDDPQNSSKQRITANQKI